MEMDEVTQTENAKLIAVIFKGRWERYILE